MLIVTFFFTTKNLTTYLLNWCYVYKNVKAPAICENSVATRGQYIKVFLWQGQSLQVNRKTFMGQGKYQISSLPEKSYGIKQSKHTNVSQLLTNKSL